MFIFFIWIIGWVHELSVLCIQVRRYYNDNAYASLSEDKVKNVNF